MEVILYGWIPAMSYYLQLPFAITAWPDLASYHFDVIQEDIQKLNPDNTLILLERNVQEDRKLLYIYEYIKDNNYQLVFENHKFLLYKTKQEEKRNDQF